MSEALQIALATLATEWFKCARRTMRLAADASQTRHERERAQLAFSAQRVHETLASYGMRMHDFDGQPYSPSLPAEPVNPEDFDGEEGLCVAETLEPTILHEGRVLMRGKIALGRQA